MSRFLRTEGDDDSDSTSESDEDSDDGEVVDDEPVKKRSRFLKGADSDSSDEESVKHIVKSAKDKRIEELGVSGAAIEQKIKINDWAAINSGGCYLLST
jgi:translation initiation factor 3 subunit C